MKRSESSLLHKPAVFLYKCLNQRGQLVSGQVRMDMEYLHPGGDQRALQQEYYVKKMEKTLLILVGGTLLAIFLVAHSIRDQPLDQENMRRRDGVLAEGREVVLEGILGNRKEEFRIYMEPVQLKTEELAEWRERFSEALPILIAGENSSLQEVRTNLELSERYEDYPFDVEWRSYNTDIIASSGEVKPGEQAEDVMLRAEISYGDETWENVLWITVLAKEYTQEEFQYKKLENLLEDAESNSREEEYWELPAMVDEQMIKWQNPTENSGIFVLIASWSIGALIYFMSDQDLHRELEEQRECMKREYPDIVHKLALYLGAGMTLRGAFEKMGVEYEMQKKQGKGTKPGYEQVLYTCRELKSGVSEGNAYERFGRRTGLQEYIRLSTLMSQNLKKGSASLLPRLHEEAERSLLQRMQMGRKLGEEASTKLLVPMIMMLGVVMVMVMLPAFLSMGM